MLNWFPDHKNATFTFFILNTQYKETLNKQSYGTLGVQKCRLPWVTAWDETSNSKTK